MSFFITITLATINIIILNIFREYINEIIIWIDSEISIPTVFYIICFISIIPIISSAVFICFIGIGYILLISKIVNKIRRKIRRKNDANNKDSV